MVKKVGKYEIGKTIGEGTFGKVKLAVNTETNEKVAIKVLDKSIIQKQNMGAQVKREISIMKLVRHSYVVQLKEVLASSTRIFLVCELITGGELFDKIVEKQRFSEDEARFYFKQLVEGVDYCHSQGVCHRDLKPENILLDSNGNVKISDFGLSNLYSGGDDEALKLLHTTCGTPNYVAPEVLADRGYDGRMADVWSLGVILYVLLAGFLPFDEPSMSNLFRKIQAADFSYPRWFSEDVRSLIDAILVPDPRQRLSIAQIRGHPWFVVGPPVASGVMLGGAINPSAEEVEGAVQEGVVAERMEEVEAEAAAAAAAAAHAGSAQARGSVRLNTFQTALPPADILGAVSGALAEMGCELRVFDASSKIKACLMTPKGMIGVVVQASLCSSSGAPLHVVEVRRGKGDNLEFSKFYRELMDTKLQSIVHSVPLDDIGALAAEEAG
ncbi:CBL-interacting-like PK [Tribonema minus]|uniref:non-specific serine/threonine protein kinase n=1 Tax=Tribonema minus TaxID=303371 RepID=A0A836CC03_9STRA|nr:CBL-interacting-like PK [Tribonema minus]